MEAHTETLQSVCRLGGAKFTTLGHSTRYHATDYHETIERLYKIDIMNDQPDVHPKFLCSLCQRMLERVASGSDHCGGGCGPLAQWEPHKRSGCTICEKYQKKSKGGRPPKRKQSLKLSGAADPQRLKRVAHQVGISTNWSGSGSCKYFMTPW